MFSFLDRYTNHNIQNTIQDEVHLSAIVQGKGLRSDDDHVLQRALE